MVWQATTRIFIQQRYNLTEASEIVDGLCSEAQEFGLRHNSSLETAHCSYMAGQYAKAVRIAKQAVAADDLRSLNRYKRNILGSIC